MEPIPPLDSDQLSRFDVFLLTEYTMLAEQRRVIREATHAEVTLFFAAVTAVGIAMGFVVRDQVSEISATAYFGGFLICSLMAGIGVLTVKRLVGFHFRSVHYARGLNLIREYFVDEEDVTQRRSIVLDTVPTEPKLDVGLTETSAGVVALISAGISGLGCFCLIRSFTDGEVLVSVICSVAVFVVALVAIIGYQVRRLHQTDKEFFASREKVENEFRLHKGRAKAEGLYRRAGVEWTP